MLPKTLFPFIFHFISSQRAKFTLTQLGGFAWTLDHTIWPLFFMVLINTFTTYTESRQEIFTILTPFFIGVIAFWLFLEFGFRFGGFMWAKTIPRLEADVRMKLFSYVHGHSYDYFSNQFAGSITNKINDMSNSIEALLRMMIFLFIPVAAAMVISVTLFFFVAPIFSAILAFWLLLHIATCLYFGRRCDTLSHIHAEAKSTLSGKIVDSLSNHINVKLFARLPDEVKYVRRYQSKEMTANEDALWYIEKLKVVLGVLSFFFPFLLLNGIMIYYWKYEWITTGEVVFIFNTSWNITMMAWVAGLEMPLLFKEIGVAKQALTLIQTPHGITDSNQAVGLKVDRGEIIFENVSFHYTPNNILFQNKSLVIHPGEKVGLVGFSGSGKTSFINLILRHYDVEKGRILIDGQDIAHVTQESLRGAIAMIPQEPVLFHRTLMENIRYGRIDASDAAVIEAATRSHCHEFIMQTPDGYNTLVGERGIKLSGGQRQRIAIARALLKNAPILILDEATSSLDSVTERHIQHDLHDLMKDRTTIVIAHRLSTIASLDRILVFHKGRVIEEGTHATLLKDGGHYAEMWRMQAGGFFPNAPPH